MTTTDVSTRVSRRARNKTAFIGWTLKLMSVARANYSPLSLPTKKRAGATTTPTKPRATPLPRHLCVGQGPYGSVLAARDQPVALKHQITTQPSAPKSSIRAAALPGLASSDPLSMSRAI